MVKGAGMSDFFKTFQPRDYQVEIHNKLRDLYDRGLYRILVRAFTGAGKTTGVAAFLPKKFPELMDQGPLMFLSHRREILFHAYSKFCQIYPEKMIGIEMGEYHLSGIEDMMFISVDSLGRLESARMKKYKGLTPGIIMCDEGHHVSEKGTWDRILNFFEAGSEYAGVAPETGLHPLVVFLTATPNRADGQTLAEFVDNWEKEDQIDYGIDYGIENGWLVAPDLYDLHLMNRQWSDMTDEDKAAAVCKVKEQYAVGLKTLIFAGSVNESKIINSTLNNLRLGNGGVHIPEISDTVQPAQDDKYYSGHVDGKTDKGTRDAILESFSKKDGLENLTNRLVLTEGYDNPFIRAGIDAGRTQSDSLFEQKVGRFLRVLEGVITPGMTREERLLAIAESDKPRVPYFALYDTSHLTLSPAIALHEVNEEGEEKIPTTKPIVDVIVYEDEESTEIPPRNWDDLDNIELFARRRDIWTGTVYNDRIHALTDLRWCIDPKQSIGALWIHKDPTGKTDTPVIWRIVPVKDREFQLQVINVGGWSEKMGRPTRSSVEIVDGTSNFMGMIRHMDDTLKSWDKKQYAHCRRDAFAEDPASTKTKKWLTDLDVGYGSGVTERTARILRDDARIKKSITNLISKGDLDR